MHWTVSLGTTMHWTVSLGTTMHWIVSLGTTMHWTVSLVTKADMNKTKMSGRDGSQADNNRIMRLSWLQLGHLQDTQQL